MLLAQAGEEKARLELALANTAQTLSLAVDREVRGYEVLLRTLAESQALREADLARFYEVAARVARENEAVFISLFAADGRQLLNTAVPYGAPLPQPFRYVSDPSQSPDEPAVGDVSALRRVISGARASNSNLFRSLTTGKLLININVPVMRDGALRYVMNIGLEPSVLRELLLAPTSSRDALGVIIDANDFILARWDGKPENVGTRAGRRLSQGARGEQCLCHFRHVAGGPRRPCSLRTRQRSPVGLGRIGAGRAHCTPRPIASGWSVPSRRWPA